MPPYSARAFVILLPFLCVACASQQVNIPESGIRALESAGRGEEFPCGDKPIHLDVVIYQNLQLYVKSSENRELSATWKADQKHSVTQHPGSTLPYDISQFEAGERKGTWKQAGRSYDYQWDSLGGGNTEMRLTLDIMPPPESTCRIYSSHINPAK